ncbi:MAG TPA: ATP synthase F1 subunit delta [Acidobacteriota bacterium]|nr:ATP synthase F1 subunit delta [Acidobacteriota bacterium]
MMISSTALTYAKALADVTVEAGVEDQVLSQLKDFQSMAPEGSELSEVLLNPTLPFSVKRKIVDRVAAAAGLSKTTVNLLLTLIQNARFERLGQVVEAYRHELDRRKGIQRADVFSVHRLEPALRSRLEKEVPEIMGSRMTFDYHIDESLIGGIKVQVGSTVLDGSVRSQLNEIGRRLSSR